MSDERASDDRGPDDDSADLPNGKDTRGVAGHRPANAAAAAASRARRIGGQARRPAGDDNTAVDAAPTTARTAATTGKAGSKDSSFRTARSDRDARTTKAPAGVRGMDVSGATAANDTRPVKSARTGSRSVWWPAAVLAVGVLAMAAVLLATSLRGGSTASGGAERDEVLAAAKACVVASNTYSYKDLDSFERKGLACGTGTFAVKFKQSVDKILKQIAPTVKQTQTFQVNYAGIISTSSTQWNILVYGQTNAVNVAHTDGETDPYGAVATMSRKNGKWLLSGLNTLCSQALSSSGNACV